MPQVFSSLNHLDENANRTRNDLTLAISNANKEVNIHTLQVLCIGLEWFGLFVCLFVSFRISN